ATNTISGSRSTVRTLASRRLPEDVRITEFENLSDQTIEDRSVLFYASGMNDGFELTLEDKNSRRRTITCNPITGKVTVEED
ncbi:MAG TPA: hypothetical protein VJ904_11065, partial [Tichowtungia sp.]|nr:hypothetical protein [Tichowtungia sp.]